MNSTLAAQALPMHIGVFHVVEVQGPAGLALLRELYQTLGLTLRLFYRKGATDAWLDVVLVCEGEADSVDGFLSALRAHSVPSETETAMMRGVSTLLRQWTYNLPGTGLDDAATEASASEGPSELRHLGPVGLKGAAYEDMKVLASKHLIKLALGCDWQEVLMVAELSTAIANRGAAPASDGSGPSKRARKPAERAGGRCAIETEISSLRLGKRR